MTANATESTIGDRAPSIIEPSRSTSTSGVSPDADASPESKTQTTYTVDPSPHPTQSDGSDVDNELSPRSGSSEPAGTASPKAELPASGTWGSCQWDIDVNGVLTIHAGTGAPVTINDGDASPWTDHAGQVTAVHTTGGVVLPAAASRLFQNMTNLTDISGLANFDTSNAKTMHSMFSGCRNLADLTPLSSWNTTNIQNLGYMFAGCWKITTLEPLAAWRLPKAYHLQAMFQDCYELTDISATADWELGPAVIQTGWMFRDCHSLSDISALASWRITRIQQTSGMFQSCFNITSTAPLKDWGTGELTDMSYMFYKCSGVDSLGPLKNWNVGNVQNMMGTFGLMTQLASLAGLEGWDVSSLVYMGDPGAASPAGGTFNNCSNLTDISALRDWKTVNVQNMRDVFSGCRKLVDLTPLSNWEMTSVIRIDGMFLSTGIQNVDALSKWDVSNVNTILGTFYNCPDLTNIDGLSEWNTSSLVYMSIAFTKCRNLKNVNALGSWDTSKVTEARDVFNECSSLRDTSALQNWNLNAIVPGKSTGVFRGCSSLELAGVPTADHNGAWLLVEYANATTPKGWTAYNWAPVNRNLTSSQVKAGYTGSNTTITDVRVWRLGVKYWGTCPWWIDEDGTLHINDVPGEGNGADNTSEQQVPWYSVRSKVKKIATQDAVHMPNRSSYLFCKMTNLTDVSGLSRWDSSKTSDLTYLFSGSKALTSLAPITSWNVSNVTRMMASFSLMDSLQSLEFLKNWNVSSLIIADHLFQGCQSVTDLEPLSNWDVSNVTNMRCLFEGCTGLKNLHGLENWDVRKVTDMGAFLSMYAWGSNGPTAYSRPTQLTDISALENWKTSSLDFASSFMAGCSKLTDIDALKNLDISKVDDLGNMFYKCTSLEDTSAIANWDASKVVKTGGMFAGDGALTRIGVPAINKGAEVVSKAYPNRNWTDEGLPITPLKDSNGIYPYMTSNTEGRDFTDNGGVFIPYQPVYIVTFDDNGATKPGTLPDRQWAYVNPTGSQSGSVNLPVGYKGLRTGYHFAGWSTTPDASSGVISPDDATWRPSGGLSTGDPSKIILYAVWEANLTSELPSTGSRGLLELLSGVLGMVGLVIATGRTRRPRHAA